MITLSGLAIKSELGFYHLIDLTTFFMEFFIWHHKKKFIIFRQIKWVEYNLSMVYQGCNAIIDYNLSTVC